MYPISSRALPISAIPNDFAEANRKYLESQGVELSEEDQKILDEYTKRFGGLPADGGFSVEAAKECLRTGKDFYSGFPDDVIP